MLVVFICLSLEYYLVKLSRMHISIQDVHGSYHVAYFNLHEVSGLKENVDLAKSFHDLCSVFRTEMRWFLRLLFVHPNLLLDSLDHLVRISQSFVELHASVPENKLLNPYC